MQRDTNSAPVILFVCEHGSAKSIVAAAHLNRLAEERGLNLVAIARDLNPDQQLLPQAVQGLEADGLSTDGLKPQRFCSADLAGAVRIVTFCPLLKEESVPLPVEEWNGVPPVSADYAKSRDAMLRHLDALLEELEASCANPSLEAKFAAPLREEER